MAKAFKEYLQKRPDCNSRAATLALGPVDPKVKAEVQVLGQYPVPYVENIINLIMLIPYLLLLFIGYFQKSKTIFINI